jgi:hypothetical protein
MSELSLQRCLCYLSLSALRRFVLVCIVAWGSSIKADGGWWLLVPLEFAVWLICEHFEGSTTFEGTTALLMVGIWSVANVVVKQR